MSVLKKAAKIFLKTLLWIIVSLLFIVLLIHTPPVQNFARKKVQAFLQEKLDTRVEIGKIYIRLPSTVQIDRVYLEDKQKDTLLYGGRIKASINMFALLSNEVRIGQLTLEGITAHIDRSLPDTVFNFQFIIDAFATPADQPADTAAAAMKIDIRQVNLRDIHFKYYDTLTGNDWSVDLSEFETRINTFDTEKFIFEIPSVSADGLVARMKQYKPLVEPEDVVADDASAAPMPVLMIKDVDLKNIDVDYSNSVSQFFVQVKFKQFDTRAKAFDLAGQSIVLDHVKLANLDTKIRLGKSEKAKLVAAKAEEEVKDIAQNNWRILVNALELDASFVQYDDDNQARQANSIDYGHLNASNINFKATQIFFTGDSIGINVKEAKLNEGSGLQLQQLRGNFLYTPTGISADDFLVQTPGTRIGHTVHAEYPSLEALQKNMASLRVSADLPDSYVQTRDLLLFAPALRGQPLFENPNAVFKINAKISGNMNRIVAEELQISGWRNTKVDLRGTVTGWPDMDKLQANVRVNMIRTTGRDLSGFLPAAALQQIQLPETFVLKGNVNGNPRNMVAMLNLQTTDGNATINGSISNMGDMEAAAYDVQLGADDIKLGKLIKNPELQNISGNFHVLGKGLTMASMDAVLNGTVQSLRFKDYTYQDVPVKASIKDERLQANFSLFDPNLHAKGDVAMGLTGMGALSANLEIDSIKTGPLNLTPQAMIYRGKLDAEFTSLDPDSLQGRADIIHSLLVIGTDRLQLDTVRIRADRSGDTSSIILQSDLGNVGISGKYKLTELAAIFMQTVQPYFAVMPPGQSDTVVSPYAFSIFADVVDNPALQTFLPGIKKIADVTVRARFASDSGWSATARTPLIQLGTMQIEQLNMQAGVKNDSLVADISTGQLQMGGNALHGFSLQAGAANNQLDFVAHFNDVAGKEKYHLAGVLKQPRFREYELNLGPEVLLNYESWAVAPDNMIRFTENSLTARNFMLTRNFQQFSLKTRGETLNSPIEAYFTSFHLGTLASIAILDSLAMDGTMDGQIVFSDLMNKPAFVGNLNITDFRFSNDTIGNVKIEANNSSGGNIRADVEVTGKGNAINIAGNYYMQPVNGDEFNFDVAIKKLNLATIEGATAGAIRNASGDVTGQFNLRGTMAKPVLDGKLRLRETSFNLTMLNNYFRVADESIVVNTEGIRFDSFRIEDSLKNAATIDGMIYTEAFPNARFDLKIRARNFQAMDKPKSRDPNDLYYGKLVFSSDMGIKGTAELPVVDGTVTIEENTDLSVLLPQQNPGVVEREGIVQFVDMDAPENDTLFLNTLALYDSLNFTPLRGLDISANVEIKKEAMFSLIIDQSNGDFIRMRGEGLLTGGIDKSGHVTLAGSYEIQEGTYEITFNFLQRQFKIQEGSKIVWTGEPTKADLNVTAVYIANTTPLDLVANQLGADGTAGERNMYLQRMPFEVQLKLTGELMKPEIGFDIVLPEDRNFRVPNDVISVVTTRLAQIRQEPNEMNKQVFALLLLNRFVTENPFQGSGPGITAEGFARQSASKLLAEQLNNLAAGLIEGVDISFDVNSYDDYSSGNALTRTDLNVNLSKRLLNDRLQVTVGSNFELEGGTQANEQASNLIGNLSAEYRLSKDGRYMLRAYRKNEYQGIIDGYVIETGVGFVITLDYNRFRNLFLSKKERERRRELRRQARQAEDEQQKKVQDNQQQTTTVPETKKGE
jgi:translocation and assembly module TamB